MSFSNNLKILRKQKKYSQDYLAEKLGYKSFTTIQKWESGISEPSVEVLKKIAEMFEISMDELLNCDLDDSCTYTSISVFSQNIRYLRKKHKMSQQELAKMLGKSESAIQMWESNKRTPTMKVVDELTRIFDIDMETLIYVDLQNGENYKNGYIASFDEIDNPDDVALAFIKHSQITTYGGYDLSSMTKCEKLEFAKQILDSVKFFASKYIK